MLTLHANTLYLKQSKNSSHYFCLTIYLLLLNRTIKETYRALIKNFMNFEKGLKSDNIFGNFRFCANSMKGQIYVFVLPFNKQQSKPLWTIHAPNANQFLTARSDLSEISQVLSRVLLAWISRYLDNLDSAISSLNLARFLKKYYAWYISWYIHV